MFSIFYRIVYSALSGLDNILKPGQINAVLGLHKISEFGRSNALGDTISGGILGKSAYEIGFKQIVVHPGYKCRHPDNDIGKDGLRCHFDEQNQITFSHNALIRTTDFV